MFNESQLYLSSDDREPGNLVNNSLYDNTSDIIRQQITHIGLKDYYIESNIPNVNPQNNVITFFSSSSGLNHTVSIVLGSYSSPDLMTAIITALNTVTGASGLTFSVVLVHGITYDLSSAGGNFIFLSSTHIDRARPLSGLFTTENPSNVMRVVVRGHYTRYIDIIIDDAKTGSVLSNSFTKQTKFSDMGHLHRIVLVDELDKKNTLIVRNEVNTIHYTRIRKRNIKTLRVELFNEFGDLLESPVQLLGSDPYAIDYFKYLFTFSLKSVEAGQ